MSAWEKRAILTLTYPVKNGYVANFDDYEKLLHSAFYNDLRVAPEESACLLMESPLAPKPQREKLTQIMFETFNAPFFYMIPKQVLSLIEAGEHTGTVVWSGGASTFVVPVYEGYSIQSAITKSGHGGNDVTLDLRLLLKNKGYKVDSTAAQDIIDNLKKSTCYVASDYAAHVDTYLEYTDLWMEFEVDKDNCAVLADERFSCTETMFQPNVLDSILGRNSTHLSHQALYKSCLSGLDPTLAPSIASTVLLGGGNTCFGGYKKRLQKEILSVNAGLNITNTPKILAREGRGFDYMNTTNFLKLFPITKWITKDEYDEIGPTIVHQKCVH